MPYIKSKELKKLTEERDRLLWMREAVIAFVMRERSFIKDYEENDHSLCPRTMRDKLTSLNKILRWKES